MTLDDATAAVPSYQLITGLLLALLLLLAAGWIFREVTGQRDSPSVFAMLAPPLAASWRASVACWRWCWSSWAAPWRAARGTFSASVGSPAHPRRRF